MSREPREIKGGAYRAVRAAAPGLVMWQAQPNGVGCGKGVLEVTAGGGGQSDSYGGAEVRVTGAVAVSAEVSGAERQGSAKSTLVQVAAGEVRRVSDAAGRDPRAFPQV